MCECACVCVPRLHTACSTRSTRHLAEQPAKTARNQVVVVVAAGVTDASSQVERHKPKKIYRTGKGSRPSAAKRKASQHLRNHGRNEALSRVLSLPSQFLDVLNSRKCSALIKSSVVISRKNRVVYIILIVRNSHN